MNLWTDYDTSEMDKVDMTKRTTCVKLESMSDKDNKDKMHRELVLQNFLWFTKQSLDNESIDVERYKEAIDQFSNNCDHKSLDYYQHRLDETPSFHNKFSYSLACWILTRNKQFLNNGIIFLISCIHILMDNETFNEIYTKIMIISNLIKFYRLQKPHLKFNEVLIKLIYKVNSTDNARWLIEPIMAFSATNVKPDLNLVNNLLTVTHKSAHHLGKKGNSHLEKRLYEKSLDLVQFLEFDSIHKEQLRKKIHELIAESLERVADSRMSEGTAAVSFYNDAKEEFVLAERHDRIHDIDVKIRDTTKNIQWSESSVKMEMQPLELSGGNGFELVNSICRYVQNIPPMDWVRNLVKDLIKEYPISSLFTNISFNDKNPTNYAETEDEIFESRVKQQAIQFIKLGEARLSLTVKDLEDSGKITAESFLYLLKSIGLHDEDQMKIISSGIEDHFNSRYIASISTLTPMIEGTLRSLMQTKGIQILRNKDKIILDKELGGMLADSQVIELLGKSFTNYIKTKYADPDGMNERNKVSHALSKSAEFRHENSLALIKTICNIAELSLKTE